MQAPFSSHVPHPADPPPCAPRQPHAHLARRFGHVDRGHPRQQQLVLGVRDLPHFWLYFPCPPTISAPAGRVAWGPRSRGTEILIGVLEVTVGDPSRSSPGARLTHGLTPKDTSGPAGDPTPIFRHRQVI